MNTRVMRIKCMWKLVNGEMSTNTLVLKLNLKSTRQIMVVIIIDYLLHILIPVEMCSVQIRNAVITQTETSSLYRLEYEG